jgi:hypothetical protein
MVGASGKLIGVQDIGARASLYRLGQLQNWAAHYPESEASFRRLLELEERLLGKDDPPRPTPGAGSGSTWATSAASTRRTRSSPGPRPC